MTIVSSSKKESSAAVHPDFKHHLSFEPLTKKTWNKFVKLFGERGACGNCWCMYYRLSRADFIKGKQTLKKGEGRGETGNREGMKRLVWARKPTGLLAIHEGEAIAWIALAPREDFIKLEKSRVHKRIDDEPVWSIPCFFIQKDFRRRGLSVAILEGAIEYAKRKGIKILEAYPTIPTQKKLPDSFLWIGLYKSFERAGFKVVDRTSKSRPMVRYYIGGERIQK